MANDHNLLANLTELRELGIIQEANRRFFHPLGLAMFASVEDDGTVSGVGIYDNRADPEGWRYALPEGDHAPAEFTLTAFKSREATVDRLWEDRRAPRMTALGYMVQPLTEGSLALELDRDAID